MKAILIYSLIAGVGTCFGAIIVCILGVVKERALAFFLGLATGIMFAVVIFDLLPSSLACGNIFSSLGGFGLGILFMSSLNIGLLIISAKKKPTRNRYLLRMGYLVAIGIALHDLPEGIAIAVGYSAAQELGLILVLAIGLHNIPEGMATATPLKMGGMAVWKIILLTGLVSFFTPFGTLLGFWLVNLSSSLFSSLLALAAGAMAYIVIEELYPESKKVHPNVSKLGIVLGVVVISLLTLFE